MASKTTYMDYEGCLSNLKVGARMTRKGWDKAMYIFITPAGAVQVPHKYGEGFNVQSIIWMKTRDDTLVPWLCSQSDALAEDWMLSDSQPTRLTQLDQLAQLTKKE